ncbi:MAG TPA: hypothetical protein VHH36_01795 [Candidatus Thermoplasmatota archaeon]|nr:hypothetical protein [Candidatus Thermoplasmatota archaeon]
MAKKREEAEEKGDYEFKLPPFDEKAFIRREIEAARASFWVVGVGVGAGLLAYGLFVAGLDWKFGWLAILVGLIALRPVLTRAGFSEDVTKPKALIGNYFMIFFTALAVWVLGVNLWRP